MGKKGKVTTAHGNVETPGSIVRNRIKQSFQWSWHAFPVKMESRPPRKAAQVADIFKEQACQGPWVEVLDPIRPLAFPGAPDPIRPLAFPRAPDPIRPPPGGGRERP